MSHKRTSFLVLVSISVMLVTFTLLSGDRSTELTQHTNSEPPPYGAKLPATGGTWTSVSAIRHSTDDISDSGTLQRFPTDTSRDTVGGRDTADESSSQSGATAAAQYTVDDAHNSTSSEGSSTGTESPRRRASVSSGSFDGPNQNRTIVQLQSQKMDEIFDSIHSRMDEIKVLRQDVDGHTVPAEGNAAEDLRNKLLKNMNISDDLIDGYFADYKIDQEPYLDDWDDVPAQLKKYAPVVFKTVPKKMDPAFKTPCWYRRSVLKCLPYFYILGMTKCGTSDLWNKTVLHPQIIGTRKETHWWTKRFDRGWSMRFLRKYTQLALRGIDYPNIAAGRLSSVRGGHSAGAARFLFEYTERALTDIDTPDTSAGRVKSNKVLGDGSPSTLWNNKYWRVIYPNLPEPPYINADVIATVTPGAKLIIILRDPVERLYSSYYFFQRKRPSPIAFDKVARDSVLIFEECMKSGNLRACTYQSTISQRPNLYPTDFTGGLYHVYLQDWMRVFPREQILILELNDWHENCEKNLAKVYDLLELDFVSENFLELSCGQATRVRPKKRPREPMLSRTRQFLEAKYQPFNDRLYDLLRDERFDWRYNRRRS